MRVTHRAPAHRRADRRAACAAPTPCRRSRASSPSPSDLVARRDALGHTRAQPARARADRLDRHLRGARAAGRPRRADARRRAGREALRARVRRPAGARDRPRPLLRRAGRARRGRAPGAGAPRRRAIVRRVRAARAGRPTWSARLERARLHPDRPTHGPRLPRRPAPERRPPHRRSATATRTRRATSSSRASTSSASRTRPSSAPSRASRCPTARAASTSTSRRSGCTSTAARSRRASACRPSRCGIHLAGVGGAFGGREDLSMQIHGALLALHTEPPGEDRLQPRGVVHRPRPPPPGADLGRAPRDARRDGSSTSAMRILLDGGAYASSSTAVALERRAFALRAVRASPNALIEATVVYTNNPPCGAMRGFGAVQTCFAGEAQMDKLAAALGHRPGRAAAPERARARRHAADRASAIDRLAARSPR